MARQSRQAALARGFTLIELLVAISLMALMAALSWRGLDGMTRAQTQMRERSDDVLTLQAALAQWGADLDALVEQPNTPSLDWDGRVLRILRGNTTAPAEGLTVVGWTRRSEGVGGQWLRWQSPPVTTRRELQLAWQKAAVWAQTPIDDDRLRQVRIAPLDEWQIFYYRTGAWSNPLSSEGAAAAPVEAADVSGIPEGLRLVLRLTAGQPISGAITRDWVKPTVGGGK